MQECDLVHTYSAMHQEGRELLLGSNPLPTYNDFQVGVGYAKKLRFEIGAAAVFERSPFLQKLYDEMNELVGYGAQLLTAGYDWPLHCTLAQAFSRDPSLGLSLQQAVVASPLCGTDLSFDWLGLSPSGEILLMATKPTAEFSALRTEVDGILRSVVGDRVKTPNVVHCTIGRYLLGSETMERQRSLIVTFVERWQNYLRHRQAMILKVESVYSGTMYNLMSRR